ncbi:hypothetical protein Salat_1699100 [Sesamum alatum]|uniref:Uncharacterized protein n=1 Tax=Sesamum alatum TaxID=300844 RepID=A0AAE1Y7K4_9LAMI|nr:hypothetical protein Salat_1699100 [Sesamum alatum]
MSATTGPTAERSALGDWSFEMRFAQSVSRITSRHPNCRASSNACRAAKHSASSPSARLHIRVDTQARHIPLPSPAIVPKPTSRLLSKRAPSELRLTLCPGGRRQFGTGEDEGRGSKRCKVLVCKADNLFRGKRVFLHEFAVSVSPDAPANR